MQFLNLIKINICGNESKYIQLKYFCYCFPYPNLPSLLFYDQRCAMGKSMLLSVSSPLPRSSYFPAPPADHHPTRSHINYNCAHTYTNQIQYVYGCVCVIHMDSLEAGATPQEVAIGLLEQRALGARRIGVGEIASYVRRA